MLSYALIKYMLCICMYMCVDLHIQARGIFVKFLPSVRDFGNLWVCAGDHYLWVNIAK
jgi:hypothetical protein